MAPDLKDLGFQWISSFRWILMDFSSRLGPEKVRLRRFVARFSSLAPALAQLGAGTKLLEPRIEALGAAHAPFLELHDLRGFTA